MTVNEVLKEIGQQECLFLEVPIRVVMEREEDDYQTTVSVPGDTKVGSTTFWTDLEKKLGALEIIPIEYTWIDRP